MKAAKNQEDCGDVKFNTIEDIKNSNNYNDMIPII